MAESKASERSSFIKRLLIKKVSLPKRRAEGKYAAPKSYVEPAAPMAQSGQE